jgi:hypothetical protein
MSYTNLPPNLKVKTVDRQFSLTVELDAAVLAAMTGFFTSRGFESVAAENIAVTLMKQASADGYNPMQILDTLKDIDTVEISALVADVLNYNRFKTSFLGYAGDFTPHQEVVRNLIP